MSKTGAATFTTFSSCDGWSVQIVCYNVVHRPEIISLESMRNSYYSAPITDFLRTSDDAILGELARAHHHALESERECTYVH